MGTTQNFEKLMAYVSTYIGESSIYVRLSEKNPHGFYGRPSTEPLRIYAALDSRSCKFKDSNLVHRFLNER